MDIVLSFSADPAWGTHAVALERRTVPHPDLDLVLAQFRSAAFGAVDGADAVWTFGNVVASPIADRFDPTGLVEIGSYMTDDTDAVFAFDRSVSERYTEFCSSIGEHYVGTFTCEHLGPEWITEIAWFDATNFEQVDAALGAAEPPEDVARILEECRALQRRDDPRYGLLLTPHAAG